MFLIFLQELGHFFKTGNRIIKTGNGIIIIKLQKTPGGLHLFGWITMSGNSRKHFIASYAGSCLFSEIMIFLDKPINYFINAVNN